MHFILFDHNSRSGKDGTWPPLVATVAYWNICNRTVLHVAMVEEGTSKVGAEKILLCFVEEEGLTRSTLGACIHVQGRVQGRVLACLGGQRGGPQIL
eukprot:1158169-Pelagomonas_calceolata.AAC.2